MGEAMVLEEGEVEGVLLPPPERLEPVEAGADLLERPPARPLVDRLGTARLGAERLAEARLGAWRLPERTGELLLTAVATTEIGAPGEGLAADFDVTTVGTTAAAGTTVAGATTGLALAGWGVAAPAGGWLEAPAPGAPAGAEAAAGAFAAESAGELAAIALGSGGVEEAMAGEIRSRKEKLGAGPLGLIRPATSGR
jgi:hypothetical protein